MEGQRVAGSTAPVWAPSTGSEAGSTPHTLHTCRPPEPQFPHMMDSKGQTPWQAQARARPSLRAEKAPPLPSCSGPPMTSQKLGGDPKLLPSTTPSPSAHVRAAGRACARGGRKPAWGHQGP